MNAPGLERLMPDASAEEREAVASRLVRRAYSAGDVVVAANANHAQLCVVESGRVGVAIERDGQTIALPPVLEGGWIGEVDLLQPGPATTTLTADVDTVLWTLDDAALEALLTETPVAGSALLTQLTRRLAARLRTATLPSVAVGADGALHAEEPAPAAAPEGGWVTRLFGRLLGGAES